MSAQPRGQSDQVAKAGVGFGQTGQAFVRLLSKPGTSGLSPGVLTIAGTALIALIYFLAARLSLELLMEPSGVAVFWPAAGVASGILIAFGPAARLPVFFAVMIATIAANLLGDRNVPSSVFFACANAGEAALVAGLIQRFFGGPFQLDNLARVLGLFVATIVGTAVSGIVGTLGFILFHSSTASAPAIWLHWFASDGLGTIVIAPVIVGLVSLSRGLPTARESAEGTIVLVVLIILCGLLVFLPNDHWALMLAVAAMCPLFVWAAARLRPRFTALATFIVGFTIVWTTTFGIGIFGDAGLSADQRILSAQATILATSFGALVLAALFGERRLHETSLLEREIRLQEALEAGGVTAFDWDVRSDELSHSENARQVLGVKRVAGANELSRAELFSRVHPEDRPYLAAAVRALNPGNPSYSEKFRLAVGGREVWLEQKGRAQFDSTGKLERIRGLTTNITGRKRLEEEISQAQRSAERADRAKSVFLTAASHDLRQPLQTLRFLQGALQQSRLEPEQQVLVQDMNRALQTMSGMLSTLLDVNRLETGNLRPSASDFAVNDVFISLADDFMRAAEERGLQMRVVASKQIIRSDRLMLEEMLRNLLSNAIRYTDRGKIILGCRRAGARVRIEVWDSGVGIEGDQLPHIFDEYYQSAEGSRRGGFGLGLAIVRRLAEILEHKVDVRSAPGKGTGVFIEVLAGQSAAVAAEPTTVANYDPIPLRGTVLIIEDENSVRASLRRLLISLGMEVVEATNGKEAARLVVADKIYPDLLLSDFNLPGPMNGVDSISAVRAAAERHIPAILMTGDIRSRTLEAIASQNLLVLTKPFSANELRQQIQHSWATSQQAVNGIRPAGSPVVEI